ncbi:CLUMA_CG010582, isoform A [Clunio marinus]|uniref:carboxylesterase n=1 Tax=Clunio marinus TaxID=568069 RepID=A0A1J1IFF3_9DIPT|nr:CLUMA_CG010582, isoform A [Clunio marinus]
MKFISVLVVFMCAAYAKGDKDMMMKIIETCKGVTGASDADIARFITHAPPETNEQKCLFACFLTSLNVIKDGKPVEESFIEMIKTVTGGDAEKMKIAADVFAKCSGLVAGKDPCDDAVNFVEFSVVETVYGPLKGRKLKSVLNTEYLSFRGIPYMKPPLGKLRFREAHTPNNWKDPFDATEEGPSYCAVNFMTGEKEGQENAGTINVYTRNTKPEKLYPVMIWVHGGGFNKGSSQTDLYQPDYLLEKNVVFVSFNYRLGAFGFLSFDDPKLEVPGNVGLKDQVLALKWVKENIEKFGGDPKQCTIFGESAGGACVHYLTITKQTEGLFQRAIIMSGSVMNKTWSFANRDKRAERLARILGWKGKSGKDREVLEFLENVPAFELVDASETLMSDEDIFGYGKLVPFSPVIEPYETENCVIDKEPLEMAREAWTNKIDVVIMGASFEGLLRNHVDEVKVAEFLKNPSFFAPLTDLGLKSNEDKAIELGTKIKQLYYEEGLEPSKETHEQYLRFCSDFHFWHGLHRLVQSRNAFASGKTYLLRFDVDAKFNMFKALKKAEKFKGACHADDLFYLFATKYNDKPAVDSKEYETIMRIVGMFTSFAIKGDVNCKEVGDVEIKPYDGSYPPKCFNITENEVKEIDHPDGDKFLIWDIVYETQEIHSGSEYDMVEKLFGDITSKCKGIENATDEDVAFMFVEDDSWPETYQGKCFIDCFFEEIGIFKNHKFHKRGFLTTVLMIADIDDDESVEIEKLGDMIKTINKECGATTHADRCENALDFAKCCYHIFEHEFNDDSNEVDAVKE